MNLDRLLYFIESRQEATDRRRAGHPRPWSRDEVVASKFFCSVRRDDDRTSVQAREFILSRPQAEQLAWATTFRLYNRVETARALIGVDFTQRDAGGTKSVFEDLSPAINANAYKINPQGGKGLFSIPDIATCVHRGMRAVLAGELTLRPTAQFTTGAISGLLRIGPFIGYQAMQDVRWLGHTYTDEATWCLVGTGALRGIDRMLGVYSAANWKDRQRLASVGIESCAARGRIIEVQTATSARFGLNMFDTEHCLCEFDVFERVCTGESKGKTFKPSP